ncbi:magnesium/cobalt transporter CorA [Oceanobacillus neutriphilus]|uniref:Magnesium transport protein CorA n=1 Tax=Oceanobacillus neutriphilus TaxID=531815 RepID=A0ABQ2NW34_9BACI|nr:magnesium/cobalt transporter CorA [Oceanobacillus neutriphilus]GGP12026.1 magnesium transport protein CorA [Oceanobacillus neutriphilus]
MPIFIHYQTASKEWKQAENITSVPGDALFIWYDFVNATSEESKLLASKFHFNTLAIEDTVKTVSRPKFKEYQDYQFLVYHLINPKDYRAQAINLFMKGHILVTYHQDRLKRLGNIEGAIQKRYPSQLVTPADIAFIILDFIVDSYFEYVYHIEDEVFSFEDRHVNDATDNKLMEDVFQIRSVIIKIKRVTMPMQELIQHVKDETSFIQSKKQKMYIHHIEDHIIKQIHIIKSAQEMTGDIRDNYDSLNSYRLNNVMKILTLVSVIFLPLTLITGIYGMNFRNMPELQWDFGYFAVLAVMLLISIVLIIYFKFKKWF